MSALRLLLIAVPFNRKPKSVENKMFLDSRVIFISGGSVGCGGQYSI